MFKKYENLKKKRKEKEEKIPYPTWQLKLLN